MNDIIKYPSEKMLDKITEEKVPTRQHLTLMFNWLHKVQWLPAKSLVNIF